MSLFEKAVHFTGNHIEYGKAMIRVINEWPISCEQNLTNLSQNRKAWIGHAACALEHGIPESVVRSAWGCLTKRQQDLANDAAQRAIEAWEENHAR